MELRSKQRTESIERSHFAAMSFVENDDDMPGFDLASSTSEMEAAASWYEKMLDFLSRHIATLIDELVENPGGF